MIQQSHFWAYIWNWWKTLIWKDTGTPGFIAPLFTVAKTWKQPKCPSIDKRIKKTENEMVGWHHLPDGHEFKQTSGFGDGHRSLACWGPWGCKESNMTEPLNWLNWSCKTSFYLSHSVPENVIFIVQITQVCCHAHFDWCFLFLFLFSPGMSKYLTDYSMLYLFFEKDDKKHVYFYLNIDNLR